MKILIFLDFFQNQLFRRTFWRKIRIWKLNLEFFFILQIWAKSSPTMQIRQKNEHCEFSRFFPNYLPPLPPRHTFWRRIWICKRNFEILCRCWDMGKKARVQSMQITQKMEIWIFCDFFNITSLDKTFDVESESGNKISKFCCRYQDIERQWRTQTC